MGLLKTAVNPFATMGLEVSMKMKNQMKTMLKNEILTVEFYGELDNTSTFQYKERLADIIDRNAKLKLVILDFRYVSFIDSSGLGLIFGRYNQLASRQGQLVICSANNHILKLLKMSGMTKVIDIYDDATTAKGVLNR